MNAIDIITAVAEDWVSGIKSGDIRLSRGVNGLVTGYTSKSIVSDDLPTAVHAVVISLLGLLGDDIERVEIEKRRGELFRIVEHRKVGSGSL